MLIGKIANLNKKNKEYDRIIRLMNREVYTTAVIKLLLLLLYHSFVLF